MKILKQLILLWRKYKDHYPLNKHLDLAIAELLDSKFITEEEFINLTRSKKDETRLY